MSNLIFRIIFGIIFSWAANVVFLNTGVSYAGDEATVVGTFSVPDQHLTVVNLIPTNDGYWLTGSVMDEKSLRTSGWIAKININNHQIWQKQYPAGSGDSEFYSSAIANDGDLIAVGSTEAIGHTPPNERSQCWIVRINAINGEPIWQKKLQNRQVCRATYIAKVKDSTYEIAGKLFGSGKESGFLMTINDSGDSVWREEIDDIQFSGIWISGPLASTTTSTLLAGINESSGSSESEIVLIRAHMNGNILDKYKFGGFVESLNIAALVRLPSDSALIAINARDRYSQSMEAWLVKISEDNKETWRTKIEREALCRIIRLIPRADHDVLVIGQPCRSGMGMVGVANLTPSGKFHRYREVAVPKDFSLTDARSMNAKSLMLIGNVQQAGMFSQALLLEVH